MGGLKRWWTESKDQHKSLQIDWKHHWWAVCDVHAHLLHTIPTKPFNTWFIIIIIIDCCIRVTLCIVILFFNGINEKCNRKLLQTSCKPHANIIPSPLDAHFCFFLRANSCASIEVGSTGTLEDSPCFFLPVSTLNFTGAFLVVSDFPLGEHWPSSLGFWVGTIFSSSYFSWACSNLCFSSITCFSSSSRPHLVNNYKTTLHINSIPQLLVPEATYWQTAGNC